MPRSFVRGELRARRWQRPFPRTYVTFTGPLPFRARVWAALLFAGADAVASHSTAAYLQELVDQPPKRIDVLVRHGHRVQQRPGVRVRQSRRIDLDFCKGCGLCVSECPSGAIMMVPEEI